MKTRKRMRIRESRLGDSGKWSGAYCILFLSYFSSPAMLLLVRGVEGGLIGLAP